MEALALTFQEVRWGADGTPLALLRIATGDEYLALDLATEEAWALVADPQAEGAGRVRLGGVLLDLLTAAGARLRGVALAVGEDGLLRAELALTGLCGRHTLTAHVADGLLLARRGGVPLTIAATQLAGYRPAGAAKPQPSRTSPDPLSAFRQVVAELAWPEVGDGPLNPS